MIDQKEDFSTKNYTKLMDFISKNYSTIFFDEFNSSNKKNVILLRHDIDISLSASLTIAKIEHFFGLKSTFFVNIHSEFYNFFERGSITCLKEILKLGHSIGIHLDGAFWNLKSESELITCLVYEKAIIDKVLEIKTNVFSFHNPTKFILSFKNDQYAGLINAYSNKFTNNFKYNSDSNGYWRHERMFDVVESLKYNRLQLLTHPGWWTAEIKHPREKIYGAIYKRAQLILDDYDQTLSNSNRKNFRVFSDQLLFIKDFSLDLFNLIDRLWNEKNYFQLYKELVHIIKLQLSMISKSYFSYSSNSFKHLDKENGLHEINRYLTFIVENDSSFRSLKNKIEALISRDNLLFENENVLIAYVNDSKKIIRELNFYNNKLNQ